MSPETGLSLFVQSDSPGLVFTLSLGQEASGRGGDLVPDPGRHALGPRCVTGRGQGVIAPPAGHAGKADAQQSGGRAQQKPRKDLRVHEVLGGRDAP